MKKSSFILAGLMTLAVISEVCAQDTLDGHSVMGNYMYYGCPSVIGKYHYTIMPHSVEGECGGELARYNYTDDSLTGYGIAAGLIEQYSEVNVYDTSCENSYESLRLYLPETDSLRWVRQTKVHLHHTPVSYYLYFYDAEAVLDKIVPVYERYFDSTITVSGPFYVGMTFSPQRRNFVEDGVHYSLEHPELWLMSSGYFAWYDDPPIEQCYDTCYSAFHLCDGTSLWYRRERPYLYMIYPILALPDTNNVPNDTLSIDKPDMVQRLTGVMPNPAVGSAKVVSSFGIDRVEVYDAAGAMVYDSPTAGFKHTLDVSRWPAGIYLIRIYTPMGTAIKKLTVAR